jgi:ATP-dependent DNA helicase RecG
MEAQEDEHLEFKEAKNNFDSRELTRYCAALANEGGGKIVLGVTDKKPRRVVGSQAFRQVERTIAGLINDLRLRVEAEEISHPEGRVLVFHVPPRPLGMPLGYQGAYWMRAHGSLVPMTPDMLKRIFDESGPDFSAEVCPRAALGDLDSAAIGRFRTMWLRKSGNPALAKLSDRQLLADAELLIDGGVTHAALVLFATRQAMGRFLARAEVVFEYRSSEASVAYQQREEYRRGFFLFAESLWNAINARNDVQHYQEGLFVWDIPTFAELVVREAVLNAVTHRDYRLEGSIFVRQFPRKLAVVSPGGFPPGITPQNVLWKQLPRNRRIAEAFHKCGLVERSGQGFDRMFQESIRHSKAVPDFKDTDDFQVSVTLCGEIRDPRFIQFLEKVGKDTSAAFTTEDLVVLDLVHCEQQVPEHLRPRLRQLADEGVVEPIGKGRGSHYILSRRFYHFLGKKGLYTRKKGLDRRQNKALLLAHIEENAAEGSKFEDLMQVLSLLTRNEVRGLLRELKTEGRIHVAGRTRAGLWHPRPGHSKNM